MKITTRASRMGERPICRRVIQQNSYQPVLFRTGIPPFQQFIWDGVSVRDKNGHGAQLGGGLPKQFLKMMAGDSEYVRVHDFTIDKLKIDARQWRALMDAKQEEVR